jgi:hypothetical protein
MQYKIVNKSFYNLFAIDRFKALELLKLFSKIRADAIIINNIKGLITVYMRNGKIRNNIFDLIGIVYDEKIKNQITINCFDRHSSPL